MECTDLCWSFVATIVLGLKVLFAVVLIIRLLVWWSLELFLLIHFPCNCSLLLFLLNLLSFLRLFTHRSVRITTWWEKFLNIVLIILFLFSWKVRLWIRWSRSLKSIILNLCLHILWWHWSFSFHFFLFVIVIFFLTLITTRILTFKSLHVW